MIGLIRGKIIHIEGNEIIVEAGNSGVGYRLYMATRHIDTMQMDQDIELHVYTQVREDAIELYGFKTRDERTLFTHLISVKGIGAKIAVVLLNVLTPAQIQIAVLTGDVTTLKTVPGVGAKVAQRLVLELESKLKTCQFAEHIPEKIAAKPALAHADTRSALKNFGFSESDIDRVLQKLDDANETLDVQGEIRWALKNMK